MAKSEPWAVNVQPPVPEPPKTIRGGVLHKAEGLINGDRNNKYGPPTQDFGRAAGVLKSLGYRGPGDRELLPHDIAVMAMAIKLSRMTWSPEKEDHWVDLAGYAGCGYECVAEEEGRKA